MAIQRIPLTGGMYQARSVIASAQRCVNLYAEKNASDAPFPYTYQLTPGLTQLIAGIGLTPHRCAYRASNGVLYEVIGNQVFMTNSSWVRTHLGTISTTSTLVSMADNGLAIILVDGTSNGYCIDMSTNTFAPIIGQGGAFYGGTTVDYVDTFFILNRPGTNQWYISLSNVTFDNLQGVISPGATAAAFDSLDIAAKTGNPDNIQAVIAMHREAWLIGTETTEVWYDAGNPDFAFSPIPGVFIEHGAAAPHSVCKQDLSVYWLSQDRQGNRMVLTGNQYAARRISTHAIENEFASYSVITDAIGFTYQQLGHTFYVLTFPTANVTWVYDVSEELWHERTWTDFNGGENRIRGNNCAAVYGTLVMGDWQNGALYKLDLNNYTDIDGPLVRRRGFPDIQINNNRVGHTRLVLDMDVGEVVNKLNPIGLSFSISLRYSDNRGKTWGNPITYSLGATGQFDTSVLFTQLGISRNRVYEVFWQSPTLTALNGGDVWLEVAET